MSASSEQTKADKLLALYARIIGKLADDGWPTPYATFAFINDGHVVWRKGERGSSVSLLSDVRGPMPRHQVAIQVILDDRYVMIDLSPSLQVWPGEHDAETLVRVLRHFRSVVEG